MDGKEDRTNYSNLGRAGDQTGDPVIRKQRSSIENALESKSSTYTSIFIKTCSTRTLRLKLKKNYKLRKNAETEIIIKTFYSEQLKKTRREYSVC